MVSYIVRLFIEWVVSHNTNKYNKFVSLLWKKMVINDMSNLLGNSNVYWKRNLKGLI